MTEERSSLLGQLDTVNTSLLFLTALIASVVLSFSTVADQRGGLCAALAGEAPRIPDSTCRRRAAGALVIGALTWFFLLSLDSWRCAAGPERPSAQRNLWAALLVLAAALIRWYDLFQQSDETLCRGDAGTARA